MKQKIRIGKIVNTHGLKGDVKIYSYADYPERFEEIGYVYFENSDHKIKINSIKYSKGMPVLKLDGINTVEEAEKMKNKYIFIDRDNLRDMEEDEHLISDLIGFEVYDTKENFIGILKDVLQYTANDVYVIEDKVAQKEYLIPGLKRFIPEVDMENSKIIIDPIEGMIE